jgi:hypothetical protein
VTFRHQCERAWRRCRRPLKLALTPVGLVLAILYFLIDGIVLSLIRKPAAWLAHRPLVARLMAQIARLGPYATLVLILVPIALLEPLKPLALYLIAKKHVVLGTTILVLAEVLKVVIVERLFHLSRNKLMSIPAFSWVYRFTERWLGYLQALPPWQFVMRRVDEIKRWARRLRTFVSGDLG